MIFYMHIHIFSFCGADYYLGETPGWNTSLIFKMNASIFPLHSFKRFIAILKSNHLTVLPVWPLSLRCPYFFLKRKKKLRINIEERGSREEGRLGRG